MIAPFEDSDTRAPMLSADGTDQAIAEAVREAELLGIDDPEMLGAFLKKLVGKIKGRIKARIAARRAKAAAAPAEAEAAPAEYSVSTPAGGIKISRAGVQVLSPEAQAAEAEATEYGRRPGGGMGIAEMVRRNPLMLAIPAGVVLLVVLTGRRKG